MYTHATALLSLISVAAAAIDGLTAPQKVKADDDFQITFKDADDVNYRVFLGAALAGANGPTCFLKNSTKLSSPMTLKIPKTVGPSADYYSIAVQDISKDNNPVTFSNKFHLDGADGNYTDYENKLGGAMFWDPNTLPCDSYDCARKCAMDNYPQDLNDKSAQGKMDACILKCPGVSMSDEVTNSQNGTDSSDAVVTITSGVVMTAIETTATTGGSTITEAVLGSNTLVLGGPAATISGEAVSLASGGVVVGKETAAFSGATESGAAATSGGSDGSAKESGAAAPSQSGKGDKKSDASKVVIAGGISLAAFVGALIVV